MARQAARPPGPDAEKAPRRSSTLPAEDLAALGRHLVALRGSRTQEDVAGAAGMARNSYQKLEAGRVSPRLGTLVNLARALCVDVRDVIPPGVGRTGPDHRRAPRRRRTVAAPDAEA